MYVDVTSSAVSPERESLHRGLLGCYYGLVVSDSNLLGSRMVRIFAGYRTAQLVSFLETRDSFIKKTGNVLDPSKMKFWSLPENVLHFPLAIPF